MFLASLIVRLKGIINSDELLSQNSQKCPNSAQNQLFTVDYSNSGSDVLNNGDIKEMSCEELEQYTKEQECKQKQQEVIATVGTLVTSGIISEDVFAAIQEILSRGFDEQTVDDISGVLNEIEVEDPEYEIIKNKNEMQDVLGALPAGIKELLSNKFEGGLNNVTSLRKCKNGTVQLEIKDGSIITAYSSGRFTHSYNDTKRMGFDNYDENGQIVSSTYIDNTQNSAFVVENYTRNEDNTTTKTIDTSSEPETRKIITTSETNEVVSVKTQNKTTGEITVDFDTAQDNSTQPSDVNSSTAIQAGEDINSQISALECEREAVQEDLTQQQDTYKQTETDKTNELGAIDTEIQTGQCELEDANVQKDDAEQDVSNAQCEAQQAQQDLQCAQNTVDTSESNLDDATTKVQDTQSCADNAESVNQEKKAEENQAQQNAQKADNEYQQATTKANDAQDAASVTAADLTSAIQGTKTAFNVYNQKQSQVDTAQKEYDNAKAAQGGVIESLWQKFKNLVASAFNKLKDAITGRDNAARELEQKQREEEKARVVNEQAQEALKKRRDEQERAVSISQNAHIILDRKTGEREVSDQEYADALLDLADAIMLKDEASNEYDSALTQYMESYNYKVDADGNLVDAQGNLVDCKQVVVELETFIQGLTANRADKEASYNSVLETTAALISGDEEKITQLDNEIAALKEQAEKEAQELAMQEQMLADLAAQKGELNAAKDSAGLADDIASLWGGGIKGQEIDFANKQELLEQALISGDLKQLEEAYKLIYGDEEVIIDGNGNVISDTSTLSDEELAKCTMAKVSDLSAENIAAKMQQESTAAINSANFIEEINNGAYYANGQTVTMEQINTALEAQALEIIEDLENAINQQGMISKGISSVNNLFGIGTSEAETRAQVEHYKSMVDRLKTCKDPKEYAALYKAITGQNFDPNSMVTLLAYSSMSNTDSVNNSTASETTPLQDNQTDITSYIDELTNSVNEQAEGDSDVLLLTNNSRAQESIQDYIQTQQTAKDAVVGVVSAGVAVLAVAAAPFTGGASLLLAGGVAGATGVTLGAIDGIYNSDDDKALEFNYTLKEAGQDFLMNAINGITGVYANGIGTAIAGSVGSNVVTTATATTFKQAAQQTAIRLGAKMLGDAAEGAIDGGLSAAGGYMVEAATSEDVDFSFETLAQVTAEGTLIGSITNVGMGLLGSSVQGGKNYFDTKNFELDLNNALKNGTSDNALADLVARNLDDNLIVDGQVNHWATSSLMSNAQNSLNALKNLDIPENSAMELLDSVPLETQAYIPTIVDNLKLNSQLLSNAQILTPDNVADLLKNLDDVQFDKAGHLISMRSVNNNGSVTTFEFDKKGNIASGVIENADGTIIDIKNTLGDIPNVDINTNIDINTNVDTHIDTDTQTKSLAQEKIEEAVLNGQDLNSDEIKTLLDDEYAKIRQTGKYAYDYGNTSFEDPIEAVQDVINPDSDTSLSKSGVVVIDGGGEHWYFRSFGTSGKCVERVSVNAKASVDMINDLDKLMKTGEYVNANGELVKLDNMTKFNYKTPQDVANWNTRQDPLTFYFSDEVNQETYDAIKEITGRHARGSVYNANPNSSWISNIEKNPTTEMVNALADEIEKYSPNLASNLRKNIKKSGDVKMSSGEFEAYNNMLNYFKNTSDVSASYIKTNDVISANIHGDASAPSINANEVIGTNVFEDANISYTKVNDVIGSNKYADVSVDRKVFELHFSDFGNKICWDADLLYYNKKGEISSLVKADIDRMYAAYKEGVSLEDAFVGKFTNAQSAIAQLNTGDICQIGNNSHISIKMADGTLKELNISAQKYLELFPPAQRFITPQGKVGDCYLIAALDTMMTKPETRATLLQCFIENADGSLTVTLPNGNVNFTIKPDEILEDIVYDEKISRGSKGMALLEYTYGLELLDKQTKRIKSDFDNYITNNSTIVTRSLNQLQNNIKFFKNLLDQKTEIDLVNLRAEFEQLFYNNTKIADLDPKLKDQLFNEMFISIDDGIPQLNTELLTTRVVDIQKQLSWLLDSYNNTIEWYRNQLEVLTINPKESEFKLRDDGGFMCDVFAQFGYNSYAVFVEDEPISSYLLNMNNYYDKYIIGGGTFGNTDTEFLNKELNIVERHAYKIEPFKNDDGSILFRVTNPWMTGRSTILNAAQIDEYFRTIYLAKVN